MVGCPKARKKDADVCGTCDEDLADGRESILCDKCLWFNFSCVCLNEMPKKKKCFCKTVIHYQKNIVLIFMHLPVCIFLCLIIFLIFVSQRINVILPRVQY